MVMSERRNVPANVSNVDRRIALLPVHRLRLQKAQKPHEWESSFVILVLSTSCWLKAKIGRSNLHELRKNALKEVQANRIVLLDCFAKLGLRYQCGCKTTWRRVREGYKCMAGESTRTCKSVRSSMHAMNDQGTGTD